MRAIILLAFVFGFAACKNEPSNDEKAAAAKQKVVNTMKAEKAARMDIAKLQNLQEEDPFCGMPITAGIIDTATVKGKLYGFCSKECKEGFLKDQLSKK